MGDMRVYGYDVAIPLVDHMHERTHQHQSFLQYIRGRPINEKLYPNYPDVDIRDARSHYLIDVEIPGISNPADITCRWTTMQSLTISGIITRPMEVPQPLDEGDTTHTGARSPTGKSNSIKEVRRWCRCNMRERALVWQQHLLHLHHSVVLLTMA
jgi:hypothetical protein